MDEADAALLGQTLCGRWKLVELVGRGGMSCVYEARDLDGTRVAIKVLGNGLLQGKRTRQRFLREGYAANLVGHPGAVRVLDNAEAEDGSLFLVMELLEGETLAQRCQRAGGHLAADEVLPIADNVLEILSAAHAKGIVHRDIKPQNIFVTSAGEVKVLDFGVAAVRDEATRDATGTQSGVALGTPAFMAPEQARGRHVLVDARTDVWAVGATMFWLLTGRHVHSDATNANEALIFAATQRAPRIATFCPSLHVSVRRLVDRALALDPEWRHPSADAMRRAVRAARDDIASGRSDVAADVDESSELAAETARGHTAGAGRMASRRAWWLGAATAAGLGAAALITVFLSDAAKSAEAAPEGEKRDDTKTSASHVRAPVAASAVRPEATPESEPGPTLHEPEVPSSDGPAGAQTAKRRVRTAKSAQPAPAPKHSDETPPTDVASGPDDISDAILDERK